MISALDSISAARGEKSLRLPIGVATRVSVPVVMTGAAAGKWILDQDIAH
jgi:hypothetical protein